MKKIGILGGTFNPIHFGHLILGQSAGEEFGLERVLIMPTKNPAYKQITKHVTQEDRVNMIHKAIKDHPFFQFSDIELKREGFTYTVDTLRKLTSQYPDTEFYFIMGGDSLFQIESWKEPEQILNMATILVATRDNGRSAVDDQIDYIEEKYDAKIYHIQSPIIEISSNDIRKRVRNQRSIRYFVPSEVREYIKEHELYEVR